MTNLSLPSDAKTLLTRCDRYGRYDHCDRYDYLAAIACGTVGGIVDIFLVNLPKTSTLTLFSDKLTDALVLKFAAFSGWKPKLLQKNSVASAIGYLEKSFKVNYDQVHVKEVKSLAKMSTLNHHMLSLGHSPSPIGLFFSILSQLTSTSAFLSQGDLVILPTEQIGPQGDSLVHRIFFGVVNWFGHLMSDVAGSSGSRGTNGRGTGIVIPFYELLSCCKFGSFSVNDARQDLATIAVRAFQEGYDLRFGLAQSVPILLTDLLTRFFWAFRQHFQYGASLKNCIPTNEHRNLRIMLICSNAALCMADLLDAELRSGGNFLLFFKHFNLPAWFLLLWRIFRELCFHIGVGETELDAYQELNQALQDAVTAYEKQKEGFHQAVQPYIDATEKLSHAGSPEELNGLLWEFVKNLQFEPAWEGDFEEHMADPNKTLRFK